MARRLTFEFLRTEAASASALAALLVANSPWAADYFGALKSLQAIDLGPLRLEIAVSAWIKVLPDGSAGAFSTGRSTPVRLGIVRPPLRQDMAPYAPGPGQLVIHHYRQPGGTRADVLLQLGQRGQGPRRKP